MKKLISLILTVVLCLSLAACGGGLDKQPAIDAHNKAGKAVNELSEILNADPETYADYIAEMTGLVEMLNQCGEGLSGDVEGVTQEDLDGWVEICNEIEKWAVEAKAELKG